MKLRNLSKKQLFWVCSRCGYEQPRASLTFKSARCPDCQVRMKVKRSAGRVVFESFVGLFIVALLFFTLTPGL